MQLSPLQIATIMLGGLSLLLGMAYLDRLAGARYRGAFRAACAAILVAAFFAGLSVLLPDHGLAVDVTKGAIALAAAAAVFYEARRESARRPIAERWRKLVGVTLGIAAILAYFNGLQLAFAKYYNRWDQYHYYMGAKYFPELGYDGLYRCAAVAQDQLGEYEVINEDTGRRVTIDMSREVRRPDKKIRNLGGDNLLAPVGDVLAHPERCTSLFSPERWAAFQRDVAFFRTSSSQQYWDDMQKDHGFNPPPVWTVAGRLLASLHPASTGYLQFLASLDLLYLTGMFAGLWWAFGWRVFAVAAVFWGCQAAAPFAWTGGAFLRQDWLFHLVMATCLVRKRYFALGAAALVYAALLRIFPGLVAIGLFAVVLFQLVRHRRLTGPQKRMLAGGLIAAAVLVPASLLVCGTGSYRQFYEHTLEVHDRTPLTNHMGLRVLVAQKTPIEIDAVDLRAAGLGRFELHLGTGRESGRMKYTKDDARLDPFEVWKEMRTARYARLRPLAWAIVALSIGWFLAISRRRKSLWVAMCLAQVFVILMSQLTCYYYSFMILGAPLTRVKAPGLASRSTCTPNAIELSLFGFVFLSQLAWRIFYWNDDKYWVLTLLSLLLCYGFLAAFTPRGTWRRLFRGPGITT